MKYLRRLRWAFEDWLSSRSIRTTIGPADICRKLGHVEDTTVWTGDGRRVVATGCKRCDLLIEKREYTGPFPRPRRSANA